MLKWIHGRWQNFINSNYPMKVKMFQLMAFCGVIASMAGAIMSAVIDVGSMIVLITLAGAIFIILLYYLGMKYNKQDICGCFMALFLNCVFMPIVFFTGGGIESGSSIWYLLCLFTTFCLLEGKMLWIVLSISYGCMIVVYRLAYLYPEYIIPIENNWKTYLDVMNALVLVSSICGCFVLFQNKIRLKEQDKVIEQSREIERLYQTKNRFFANMSHEIRTPINTIIGLNEMILREDVSPEIAENATHIQEASKMLLALINDVLDISKLESGKMEIIPMQYEPSRMFSELVNLIWIRAQEKKLEFRVDVAPDIPSVLFGDDVRIKQIVTNLLTNAVKYTEKGSVTLVARSERVDANRVKLIISVKDTGIGIRKEDMHNLFDSFQRMDKRTNANVEGTGLGLSISGHLSEMMGGKITVNSIYQRGSVFTFQVEQTIVDAKPMGHMDFMIQEITAQRKRYHQSFEAPEARVLIVDDNETNLLVAKKLLRETKVRIDTARSGKECLERTKQFYYHVIFMDQLMPEMGGAETLTKLRRQENGLCRDVPVIALTANVTTGAEQIYKDIGFNGYLAKPIDFTLLEATLMKHLPQELLEYYALPEEDGEKEDFLRNVSNDQKKRIYITTDFLCDLPKTCLKRYDIGLMHCYVKIDDARFSDGKEISAKNFIEYLEHNDSEITTQCAQVEEYESFFANALGIGEHVIHIAPSQITSVGFQRASAAAQGFDHVTVIDSGHLSAGLGLIAMSAADMAENGSSVQEILAKIERLKSLVSSSVIVDSADFMYRNGRVSRIVKALCDAFQLHLVMKTKNGAITLGNAKHGKMQDAYRSYIRNALKDKKDIDTRVALVTHTGCTARQINEFRQEIAKYQKFENVFVEKASATVSCNCGPGSMGLTFMRKETMKKPELVS